MGVGRAHAVSLLGLDGAVVEIEADVGSGLPYFALVGLPCTLVVDGNTIRLEQ